MHALRFSFPVTDIAKDKRTYFGIAVGFFMSELATSFASRTKDLGCTVFLVVSEFLASLTWKIVDVDGMGRGS